MAVLVLDKRKKPLMPCSEKRARLLLERGRAVVHRMRPFTIRLKDRTVEESALQPIQIKIDPGSKTTGVTVIREDDADPEHQQVLMLMEIEHRGQHIKDALTQRRAFRRRRRGQLRHRAPRFHNRTRPSGWLAPSLQHRVDTTMAWVNRLCRLAPVTGITMERVRFDTQAMENPEISGVEYQQGTLHGYEVREYLLEKWQRCCAYCGAKDLPLEVEHIHPRSRGGSDRVSNLTLACPDCNQAKGNQPVEVFLADDPKRLQRIEAQAKAPLKDAAAVNSTRWALFRQIQATGLPVITSSGGRTKYNRQRLGIPKTHALDAACVGPVTAITHWNVPTLTVRATGRGSYQRTRLNRFGFPRGYLMRQKQVKGFQTGDLVQANVPTGKKAGTYQGRVAIRATGSFNIQTREGVVQGISHRHCRLLQRADGYGYALQPKPTQEDATRAA
ncbi:RNA-guided endonuclease IscB [Ectothiorhodospira shaposhnikovii]|uniref:RNA-guided endonuclease IscB n=1 Tax=Ectothiorhodospira shaposhnikovii TaxID=1054 RepID=UPI001EE836D1|nr:RNA-guided endonuclease IscB [Ectothiorhodospira shaposhnikovii]MCG5511948.1 RNA-guided endonuclease IscB [Ectothiorhodospira shaposhnikovii]